MFNKQKYLYFDDIMSSFFVLNYKIKLLIMELTTDSFPIPCPEGISEAIQNWQKALRGSVALNNGHNGHPDVRIHGLPAVDNIFSWLQSNQFETTLTETDLQGIADLTRQQGNLLKQLIIQGGLFHEAGKYFLPYSQVPNLALINDNICITSLKMYKLKGVLPDILLTNEDVRAEHIVTIINNNLLQFLQLDLNYDNTKLSVSGSAEARRLANFTLSHLRNSWSAGLALAFKQAALPNILQRADLFNCFVADALVDRLDP